MTTLRDIATHAGVSVRTASMVLRGREKEGRISPVRAATIREIAERLDYRPNSAARAMRSRRTGLIGVLVQTHLHLRNPTRGAFELAIGINAALDDAGNVMCLIPLADVLAAADMGGDIVDDSEKLRLRVFRERLLDGMIVVNAVPEDLHERLVQLVPDVIWVDHNRFTPTHCVRRDEVHAGYTTVSHVAGKGYRKVLYVEPVSTHGHYSMIGRRSGVERAAREHGVQLETIAVPMFTKATQPPQRLRDLTPEWAVVSYDARLLRDLALFTGQWGLRMGRDFGLAGCEDNSDLWHSLNVVSRMGFDRDTLGRHAAGMMLRLIEDPTAPPPSVELRDKWIEGETTPGPR